MTTAQRWTIDPSHSSVTFAVRHMIFAKVRGAFTKFEGSFEYDAATPTAARTSASIDAGSIDTREPQRDEHLRSADFLDVQHHPRLAFESTSVEPLGREKFRITGDLTIRGTTRAVDLEVEHLGGGKDPWGNERIGFLAKTTINRKDFGLTWNQVLEAGGVLVGEDVEITLDIQAIRAA